MGEKKEFLDVKCYNICVGIPLQWAQDDQSLVVMSLARSIGCLPPVLNEHHTDLT